jgi:dTMP kinase
VAFFERVAAGYAARMKADPSRFVRIDADQAPEGVWQAVAAGMRGRGLLP